MLSYICITCIYMYNVYICLYIMYIYNVYSLNGMEINPSSYVDISSINSIGTTFQGPERQALRFVMGLNAPSKAVALV